MSGYSCEAGGCQALQTGANRICPVTSDKQQVPPDPVIATHQAGGAHEGVLDWSRHHSRWLVTLSTGVLLQSVFGSYVLSGHLLFGCSKANIISFCNISGSSTNKLGRILKATCFLQRLVIHLIKQNFFHCHFNTKCLHPETLSASAEYSSAVSRN